MTSETGEEKSASPTRLAKRSLRIAGHLTSISLEDAFWSELKTIAARRNIALAALAAQIDRTRGEANLSSALRVFVLSEAIARASPRTPEP